GSDRRHPTALTDCPHANFTGINVRTFLEKPNTRRCVSGHILDGRPNQSSGGCAPASFVLSQHGNSVLRKECRQFSFKARAPVRARQQNDGRMRPLCQWKCQCSGKGNVAVAERYFLFIVKVRFNLSGNYFGRARRLPLESSHLTLFILNEGSIYLDLIRHPPPWPCHECCFRCRKEPTVAMPWTGSITFNVRDSSRRFVGRSPLDRYVSIAPYLVIAYILVKNFCIKGDGADKMKCYALTP